MTEKSYAWCRNFESTECLNIGSQIMQRVFSPESVHKGGSSNIADDWDILFARDMCASCERFKNKTLSESCNTY